MKNFILSYPAQRPKLFMLFAMNSLLKSKTQYFGAFGIGIINQSLALEIIPEVAKIMASELGWSSTRMNSEIEEATGSIKSLAQLHHLSLIHISEPTRPLYISYAVFCLKKKKKKNRSNTKSTTVNQSNITKVPQRL
eukprot:TRINITY_DN2367_c0_g1_i2.p3 TRINITY_DN2367_c0_g1~~TRINITY_DN2367_c0_g1_i2.p3  ORF type:complete len:137 (-),score=24.01 TRINITY_DN2367_c0_g1_i2:64-474(-)